MDYYQCDLQNSSHLDPIEWPPLPQNSLLICTKTVNLNLQISFSQIVRSPRVKVVEQFTKSSLVEPRFNSKKREKMTKLVNVEKNE